MERLSENVRKALEKSLHEKKGEEGSLNAETMPLDSPAPEAEFPSEPFPCPACGQLLAPSCRICVACKHPINPAELACPQEAPLPATQAQSTEPRQEQVRFPWRIFVVVLSLGLILGQIFLAVWGEQKGPLVIQSVPILVGLWVFYDALRRSIPRPLRWAVGSMLLLIVIFPWYLARRSRPDSVVPFVEAEVGPVTRFLLFALLILTLACLIFYIVEGPAPGTSPAPPSKEHNRGGSSPTRISALHSRKGRGMPKWRSEGLCRSSCAWRAQGETSAPSDAWHT